MKPCTSNDPARVEVERHQVQLNNRFTVKPCTGNDSARAEVDRQQVADPCHWP